MPHLSNHRIDRYIFSSTPPSPPIARLPHPLSTLHVQRQTFRRLLSEAFPPLPPFPQNRDVLLDNLCDTLSSILRLLDVENPHPFLTALLESRLLDDVCHALHLCESIAHPPTVTALLRALNACTVADFLTTRIAENNVIPVLFSCFYTRDSTDLALALLEELFLHSPPFDLSTVPNLSAVIPSLSPLHLGALCRVLAPLIDEREALCGGDHCTGQCASIDWRQIDDAAVQLRARTSYVDAFSRVVRDRNHATLLAIPSFLPRLVKLISVPPARRQDLALVDHAVPTGVFSLNGDVVATPHPPVPSALDVIFDDIPSEEHVHQRIIFMVFRRLTGLDADDADVTGADSWPVFERRLTDAMHPRSRPERDPVDDVSTTATASDTGDAADVPNPNPETNAEADGEEACPVVSINGMLMSRHQIEVLFVLYSLLIGKRRTGVQHALIKAGIFSALNRFCDALDWSDCERETRTEDSLKVHFIRLLHYMCDGLDVSRFPERQQLLFTEAERTALRRSQLEDLRPLELRSPASVTGDLHLVDFQKLSLGSPHFKLGPPSLTRCESELKRSQAHLSPPRPSGLGPVGADGFLAQSHEALSTSCPTKARSAPTSPIAPGAEKQMSVRDGKRPDEEKGLILKMVTILMNTNKKGDASNTRRFVLSGCIETFQRSATIAEKTFIGRQGLLAHLIEELAKNDLPRSQVSQFRQTSFDLLGQLIKWNRDLFNDANEMFRRDRRLFPRLLEAVSDRLVDSNVFVRSIALSLERFRSEDELQISLGSKADPAHRLYDFDNCFLWEFLETYRVRLIHDLLSSVRVEDITFENICCINTTLILFVVSCRDTESFDDILSKLADLTVDLARSGLPNHSLFSLKPIDVIQNFAKLVDFWLNYYRYQGVDVFSLEVNTNISFSFFVNMAHRLRKSLPTMDAHIRREVGSSTAT